MTNIYFRLNGGLGNQLSQYAASQKFIHEFNLSISFDKYYLSISEKEHEKIQLSSIFSPIVIIDSKLVKISRILNRILFKLGFKSRSFFETVFYFERFPNRDEIFKNKSIIIEGFWQNNNIYTKKTIHNINYFLEKEVNSLFKSKINNRFDFNNTCAIHIRRGDYLTNRHFFKLQQYVLPISYYLNSLAFINKSVKLKNIVIFTDSVNDTDTSFISNYKIFYAKNYVSSDLEEFYLMSCFKFLIIANSTYSLWAGLLNDEKEKIVCAPNIWHRNSTNLNIIPDKYKIIKVI